MKPKIKSELVRVEYWDCGNPDHRHKTEEVARSCIQKRKKQAANSTFKRKWTTESYASVLKQYRDGARQCDIARSVGISAERMRQVLAKAARLERDGEAEEMFPSLSIRTRNCLRAEDLRTVEDVRTALKDGKLDNVPNFGKVSRKEVENWLDGLPLQSLAVD